MHRQFKVYPLPKGSINILPSFAESRQMKVLAWELLALLATAVSVLRGQDYAVCALPSGRERQKGVFWQLFRPKKLPSGAAAIRCIRLLKAKPLNQNADRV